MVFKWIAAGLVGIGLGIVGARYLFVGSYLSLIPWGLAGLLIGLSCLRYRDALIAGGVYGFLLVFAFMIAGYEGTIPVVNRLPSFALLGLAGVVCGIASAAAGCFVRRKTNRGS